MLRGCRPEVEGSGIRRQFGIIVEVMAGSKPICGGL